MAEWNRIPLTNFMRALTPLSTETGTGISHTTAFGLRPGKCLQKIYVQVSQEIWHSLDAQLPDYLTPQRSVFRKEISVAGCDLDMSILLAKVLALSLQDKATELVNKGRGL